MQLDPTPIITPADTQPEHQPDPTQPDTNADPMDTTPPQQQPTPPTEAPADPPKDTPKPDEISDSELLDFQDEQTPPSPSDTQSSTTTSPQMHLPLNAATTPITSLFPAPYLVSEPEAATSQALPPPLEVGKDIDQTPPSEWSHFSGISFPNVSTGEVTHYTRGIRAIPQDHILSDHRATPDLPLPFYGNSQSPKPESPHTTSNPPPSTPNRDTTHTPPDDPRTHPFVNYVTRTTSKIQHTPETPPQYRMILINWAYTLTSLFHCSLPPYVMPECMKWLLTTTNFNHGFRLGMTPLLSQAAQDIASDTTTPANPNSTWDLTTPDGFLKLARPHLTAIARAPTNATRHALITHSAVIEQWLHVGLHLYPINTIAQQLWTVAFSYAQHVLNQHPGHHLHANHPENDLDPEDPDYLETHPFNTKFALALHPTPITHSRTYKNAIQGQPMRFAGKTTSTLFTRFRNLMRLRGALLAIRFIVRAHLIALHRREYTDRYTDEFRRPLQANTSTGTAILHDSIHSHIHLPAIAPPHHYKSTPRTSRHYMHPSDIRATRPGYDRPTDSTTPTAKTDRLSISHPTTYLYRTISQQPCPHHIHKPPPKK